MIFANIELDKHSLIPLRGIKKSVVSLFKLHDKILFLGDFEE